MRSTSTKRRTVSTAVLSKTQLPKITPHTYRKLPPVTKKLFPDNISATHPPKGIRQRINTQAHTQRTSRHEQKGRMASGGYRRLEQQLGEVSSLFNQIEKLRQSYGIVSLNERGEEQQRSGDCQQVPYDPTLHAMNEQICIIKAQIEQGLEKVFRTSKQYPKLQHLIEVMLEQHLNKFLAESGRNGKIAAMKAQHRLIQSSREKLARMCRF